MFRTASDQLPAPHIKRPLNLLKSHENKPFPSIEETVKEMHHSPSQKKATELYEGMNSKEKLKGLINLYGGGHTSILQKIKKAHHFQN